MEANDSYFRFVQNLSARSFLQTHLKRGLRFWITSTLLTIAIQFAADAQTYWNVANGDWATIANWTNGVPNPGVDAIIGNNGTATISSSDTDEAALGLVIGGLGNGALTINGGSLAVGANGITMGNSANGILTLSSGTVTDKGSFLIEGNGVLNLDSGTINASQIVVNSTGALNFGPAAGQTVTVNAAISGLSGRTVTFNTAGTVVLSYQTDFGSVTIGPQATLQLSTAPSVSDLAGTGPITDNGSLVLNSVYGGAVPNNISGSGSVTLVQGQWFLNGTNTYSGTTTLNGGTLIALNSGALSGKSAFIVNAGSTLDLAASSCNIGSLAGNGLVTCNSNDGGAGFLTVGDTNTSTTFSGEISDSPSISDGDGVGLTKVGTGTLILTGSNTITYGVTIKSGTLQLGNGGTTGSLVSKFAPFYAPLLNNGTLIFDRSDALNFGFAIQGTGNVVQEGSGTTTLIGDDGYGNLQNYSGTTTVSAGTLQAGSTSGFSPNSEFTVDAGATLDLNGFSNTIGSLAGSGTVTNNGTTAAILTIGNDGTSTTFSGDIINGTSGLGLTKIGAGTLTLTGSNTYSGPTTVGDGILRAGSSTAFSSASAFVVNGILDLNGNSSIIGSLAGSGTVTNNGPSAVTFTAGQDGSTTAFSGNLTDGSGGR